MRNCMHLQNYVWIEGNDFHIDPAMLIQTRVGMPLLPIVYRRL